MSSDRKIQRCMNVCEWFGVKTRKAWEVRNQTVVDHKYGRQLKMGLNTVTILPITEVTVAALEKWHHKQVGTYTTLHLNKQTSKCWLSTRSTCGVSETEQTVWRTLSEDCVQEETHSFQNPQLSKLHEQTVREHEKKPDDYWQHILWRDETQLFGSDGVLPVWRGPGLEHHSDHRILTGKPGGGSVPIHKGHDIFRKYWMKSGHQD